MDRRMPDHGHPISSPCEPNGSGELKKHSKFVTSFPIRCTTTDHQEMCFQCTMYKVTSLNQWLLNKILTADFHFMLTADC